MPYIGQSSVRHEESEAVLFVFITWRNPKGANANWFRNLRNPRLAVAAWRSTTIYCVPTTPSASGHPTSLATEIFQLPWRPRRGHVSLYMFIMKRA